MIFLSGHSHWAGIKHRKAAQDAKKGVAFQKLIKDVIAAAKAGGGDPNSNFRLKVAIDRARAGNVPVDNIERGIKRGTGELGGEMALLCCLVASAQKQSVQRAARIPRNLLAVIDMPIPVPQIKIPISHSPDKIALHTFFAYTG